MLEMNEHDILEAVGRGQIAAACESRNTKATGSTYGDGFSPPNLYIPRPGLEIPPIHPEPEALGVGWTGSWAFALRASRAKRRRARPRFTVHGCFS